jgi:5-(carboxyamino)imidazole ribonucleotide mutase
MTPIAIVIGSESDKPVMAECKRYLDHFGVAYDEFVLSAHRTPKETAAFAEQAEERGYQVIIAAAGMAAHLPGVIAAHTTLPVLGVPLAASDLKGVDALYAIVQMPSGVPVGTLGIGKAGAVNAAVLAVEILSLGDSRLKEALRHFKEHGCRI